MQNAICRIWHVYFTSANCVWEIRLHSLRLSSGGDTVSFQVLFPPLFQFSSPWKVLNGPRKFSRGRLTWCATLLGEFNGLSDRQARRGLRGWVGQGPAGVSNDRKLCFDSQPAVRRGKRPRIDALPMAWNIEERRGKTRGKRRVSDEQTEREEKWLAWLSEGRGDCFSIAQKPETEVCRLFGCDETVCNSARDDKAFATIKNSCYCVWFSLIPFCRAWFNIRSLCKLYCHQKKKKEKRKMTPQLECTSAEKWQLKRNVPPGSICCFTKLRSCFASKCWQYVVVATVTGGRFTKSLCVSHYSSALLESCTCGCWGQLTTKQG